MEAPADFLLREAELLDDARFDEWLELLHPDIDYRVPVRVVPADRNDAGFSRRAYYYRENHTSIVHRVERLSQDDAWAENPRTRTRRMVANVRGGVTEGAATPVRSNLALFCYRHDDPTPIIITGERHDALRQVDGTWRLAARTVYLDSTVLGLQSLSVFL